MVKSGMKMDTICETLGIRQDTLSAIVSHPYFTDRLDKFIKAKTYLYRTSTILAMDEIFNKLWARTRLEIDKIPAEICLKELTRLVPIRTGPGRPKEKFPELMPKQAEVSEDELRKNLKMMGIGSLEESSNAEYFDGPENADAEVPDGEQSEDEQGDAP